MPSVPDADDVKDEASSSIADGAVYGLGITLGSQVAGGVGHAGGGLLAGASIEGQKGDTLSTLAVAQGMQSVFAGGGSTSGGSSRGVK